MELTPGVLEGECRTLVQEFFRARRRKAQDKCAVMKDG
jgi:hypothetical protein